MEDDLLTVAVFGDSITKGMMKYLSHDFLDHSICGLNSVDAVQEKEEVMNDIFDKIILCFGTNDWRQNISLKVYKHNLLSLIRFFEEQGVMVFLMTVPPTLSPLKQEKVRSYNRIVEDVAQITRVKVIDLFFFWKQRFKLTQLGMHDRFHPNRFAYRYLAEVTERIVARDHTVVLWEYNGHECNCNYNCPYCYYNYSPRAENYFIGDVDRWHRAFKESFGNRKLIFYLTFGEPTLGEAFFDIVEMIGSEPGWSLRITTNLSLSYRKMQRLMETRLVKTNRLYVNTSFHPLSVSKEEFLEKLFYLRKQGIECPVIYVMYPPFLKRFHDDLRFFTDHGFVVHLRRFIGSYKGKYYPDAYSDEELQLIARFSDMGTIKYMMNEKPFFNRLSFSGYDFFIVSCTGDIGRDSNCWERYSRFRAEFGNVIEHDYVRFPLHPLMYPVGHKQGTVDGVSNLWEAEYDQLMGNNVLDFSQQGGVYAKKGQVFYEYEDADFNDSRLRADLWFSPRNLQDRYYRLKMIFHLGFLKYVSALIHEVQGLLYHYRRQGRTVSEFLNYVKGGVLKRRF